jgi:hypothetical protein
MEVINHPLFGNTLVTKQAVAPGELLLREAPLIICKDTNDPSSTFATQLPAVRDAFTSATAEVQEKVMKMMWYEMQTANRLKPWRSMNVRGQADMFQPHRGASQSTV